MNGTNDNIVADSLCWYIYSASAKFQPVISRFSLVIDSYTVSININPTVLVQIFLEPFFVLYTNGKNLRGSIKDQCLELNFPNSEFRQLQRLRFIFWPVNHFFYFLKVFIFFGYCSWLKFCHIGPWGELVCELLDLVVCNSAPNIVERM